MPVALLRTSLRDVIWFLCLQRAEARERLVVTDLPHYCCHTPTDGNSEQKEEVRMYSKICLNVAVIVLRTEILEKKEDGHAATCRLLDSNL